MNDILGVILDNDVILIGQVESEIGHTLVLDDVAALRETEDGVVSIHEFFPNLTGENRQIRIALNHIFLTFTPRDELIASFNKWRGVSE